MADGTMDNDQVETINLLDVAVFLARYWLILFVMPLVAGVIFYFISIALPSNYLADTKIVVPKFFSEDVLNSVSAKILQSPSKEKDSVRVVLDLQFPSRKEGSTLAASDGLISIHATSPQRESSINAVRSYLNKVTTAFNQAFQQQSDLLEMQSNLLRKLQGSDDSRADIVWEIFLLTKEITAQTEMISAGNNWVKSLSDLEIGARPTSRPLVNAVVAIALTGFLALLFAILHTLIRHLRRHQPSRIKLDRARDAFFMRGRVE